MGCGSSKTSESKLKAQPIGPVYLLGGVNPERITRLLMPQWKLSGTDAGAPPGGVTGVPRMSSLTVTTCVDGHGGGALVMQVARRRYVGNSYWKRKEGDAHDAYLSSLDTKAGDQFATPAHNVDGSLLAVIAPVKYDAGLSDYSVSQVVYATRPRWEGQAADPLLKRDDHELYPWAEVHAHLDTYSGKTQGELQFTTAAAKKGFEAAITFRPLAKKSGVESGYFTNKDGEVIGFVDSDRVGRVKQIGTTRFTAAAGADVALLLLCHLALTKCVADGKPRGEQADMV